MCCPISAFRICMVVLPSGVIVNQIAGVYADMPSPMAACAVPLVSALGSAILMKVPAAVAAERTRNCRRVTVLSSSFVVMSGPLLRDFCGAFDCTDDARIGCAPTQVAVHGLDDFRVVRGWIDRQQRCGLHDLTGLTVAALGYLQSHPRLLHGMGVGRVQAFNGGDARTLDFAQLHHTGPY